MKRLALLVVLFTALGLAAQPVLNKVYFYDYGPVTRLVLAFDRMPEYRFDNAPGSKRITIDISSAVIGGRVSRQQTVGSSLLSTISVLPDGNGIKVNVLTRQTFTAEPFRLQNGVNKIVLDIYTTKSPSAARDQIALARFYYLVHFYPQATELCQRLDNGRPELSALHYYWGKILLESGRRDEAAGHFRKVGSGTEEYRGARNELTRLDPREKADTTPTNKPKPESKPRESAPSQTKQPAPPPSIADDSQKADPSAIGSDSLQTKYLGYFTNAGTLPKQLLLLGLVAQNCGDHASAVRYLTEALNHLEKSSPQAAEIHRRLADSYAALNKPDLAKIHRAQATPDAETAGRPTSLLSTRLPLWLALLLALCAALIVMFLVVVFYHRKRLGEEPEYSLDDVESERIAEGYRQTYNSVEPEQEMPETPSVTPELPTEPEPVPPETASEGFDIYHPPIIAEELTPEEDQELEQQERPRKYDSVNYDLFGKEERLFEGLNDSGYKSKMVRKLAQDGWEPESIAKELQLSLNEVEFILKTE